MRILGIDPHSKGISYAVLENGDKLIDWSTKRLPKRKTKVANIKPSCKAYYRDDLVIMENLIELFSPDAIVCEDWTAQSSRRGVRVTTVLEQINLLAAMRKLPLYKYSRLQMMGTFIEYGAKTKHDVASYLGAFFPDLQLRVPKKRKAWMSEGVWMNVFMALAFCVTFFERGNNPK